MSISVELYPWFPTIITIRHSSFALIDRILEGLSFSLVASLTNVGFELEYIRHKPQGKHWQSSQVGKVTYPKVIVPSGLLRRRNPLPGFLGSFRLI